MHFLVHVILPKELGPAPAAGQVEAVVEKLLTPYWTLDGENEDGWWDWYEVGGRFEGSVTPLKPLPSPSPSGFLARLFPPKPPTNTAPTRDVLAKWTKDNAPFVVVSPDGKAHGAEDWSKEDFAPWEKRFRELLVLYAEHLVVGVDCHL